MSNLSNFRLIYVQRKVILPSFYDFQYLTTVRQSTGDKSNVHHATLVC